MRWAKTNFLFHLHLRPLIILNRVLTVLKCLNVSCHPYSRKEVLPCNRLKGKYPPPTPFLKKEKKNAKKKRTKNTPSFPFRLIYFTEKCYFIPLKSFAKPLCSKPKYNKAKATVKKKLRLHIQQTLSHTKIYTRTHQNIKPKQNL